METQLIATATGILGASSGIATAVLANKWNIYKVWKIVSGKQEETDLALKQQQIDEGSILRGTSGYITNSSTLGNGTSSEYVSTPMVQNPVTWAQTTDNRPASINTPPIYDSQTQTGSNAQMQPNANYTMQSNNTPNQQTQQQDTGLEATAVLDNSQLPGQEQEPTAILNTNYSQEPEQELESTAILSPNELPNAIPDSPEIEPTAILAPQEQVINSDYEPQEPLPQPTPQEQYREPVYNAQEPLPQPVQAVQQATYVSPEPDANSVEQPKKPIKKSLFDTTHHTIEQNYQTLNTSDINRIKDNEARKRKEARERLITEVDGYVLPNMRQYKIKSNLIVKDIADEVAEYATPTSDNLMTVQKFNTTQELVESAKESMTRLDRRKAIKSDAKDYANQYAIPQIKTQLKALTPITPVITNVAQPKPQPVRKAATKQKKIVVFDANGVRKDAREEENKKAAAIKAQQEQQKAEYEAMQKQIKDEYEAKLKQKNEEEKLEAERAQLALEKQKQEFEQQKLDLAKRRQELEKQQLDLEKYKREQEAKATRDREKELQAQKQKQTNLQNRRKQVAAALSQQQNQPVTQKLTGASIPETLTPKDIIEKAPETGINVTGVLNTNPPTVKLTPTDYENNQISEAQQPHNDKVRIININRGGAFE